MHINDKKRAIIASKRGPHAATGLNGNALDRALLAIFPDVRADSVDSFAAGYHAGLEGQTRMDSAPDFGIEQQRQRLIDRGFDVKHDSADKVGKIYKSVFPRG